MKRIKRLVLILLSSVCLFSFCVSAMAEAAPEPKAINSEDLALKLEKGEVNILTENYDAILKASGKKFAKRTPKYAGDTGYVLKAKGYTFYSHAGAGDIF